MGVRGLLLISMAWRYGDIELGVGILVMFSFVYIALGIMARMPPLATRLLLRKGFRRQS